MTIGLWLPRLLFRAIVLSATLTTGTQAAGGFVDTTTCYDGLAQADANGDNRIEPDEYLTFVQFVGPPGFLEDIDSMFDAPLTLQGSFLALACICGQNGGDAQCCIGDNAHIPIDINNPDSNTLAFLFLVCSLTSRSIDLVLEEPPPSSISTSPTTFPTISLASSPMPSNYAAPTATATRPTATQEPTQSPSSSPSAIPTTLPRPTTSLSCSSPSSSPSVIPTTPPRPTTSPSSSPPSSSPSAIPTTSLRRTTSPSSSSTSIPSAVPLTEPSSMPAGEGIGVVLVQTIYTVVIVDGIIENVPESSYVPDLIASMNVVAVEVASEFGFGGASSNGSSRRRLEVRVLLPTFIDGVVDAVGGLTDMPDNIFELGACPSDLVNPENDKCEQVTASIVLFEAPQVARQLYQTALHRAIVEGRLQDALMEINPDSPARIITGKPPGTNGVNTAGIVIGAVAVSVLVLTVAILITRKRVGKPAFDELQPLSLIPSGEELEPDSPAKDELDSTEKQRTDEEAGTVRYGEAILGGAKAYYRQSSTDEDWSRADGVQIYIEGRSRASSTASAGQSDWPSICMSSLDSGSEYAEDELDPATFGTIMFVPDTGSTALDNAIVEGDRTAVGATAALLAANARGRCDYEESSFSSNHSSIETGDSSLKVRLDEQRAAELDRLIEGGDWEGIIRAAKIFSSDDKSFAGSIVSHQDSQGSAYGAVLVEEPKAAELHRLIQMRDWERVRRSASTISCDDRSFDGSILSHQDSQGSASSAGLVDEPKVAKLHRLIQVADWEGVRRAATTFSSDEEKSFDGSILSHQDSQGSMHNMPIEGPATSTGTSKNRDRAEVRRQVEELLQQVAPEDMDQVDEKLLQFHDSMDVKMNL